MATLTCACLTVGASAFECPVPHRLAAPGVLAETQAQIDQTGKMLSGGDVLTQVQTIIGDLRKRYPNVQNAELENYLVTAYCPVAAAWPGASDGERKVRIDGFVGLVMGILY